MTKTLAKERGQFKINCNAVAFGYIETRLTASKVNKYDGEVWSQAQITLQPRPRGVHLVTGEVIDALDELEIFSVGLCQLFIRHTSASLTLGENASPDVRDDTLSWLDAAVPESFPWTHTLEGADDMPAHIKSMITGPSLLLPIANGSLALGTWQGIYLCEHRDHGGPRSLVATLSGETASGT